MSSPRVRPDGFLEVGPVCAPFDCQISLEDANDLRKVLIWDFFDKVDARTPIFTETEDRTLFGKGFRSDNHGLSMQESPSTFGGAILKHMSEDSWRMIIKGTKTRRSVWNNAQQRIETMFDVQVYNDELVEAVRRVKVIRGVGELTVDAIVNQMEEDVDEGYIVMQRRAFERHMTSEDCERAGVFLRQIAARSRVE